MTNNRDLDEILAELGREHRAIDAPDSLEPVLRAATRARKHAAGKQALRFGWAWAAVALLLTAVATAGIIWRTHHTQSQQVRSVPVPQIKPEPVLPSVPVRAQETVLPKSAPLRKGRTKRAGLGRDSSLHRASWNSLDEFIALPVSEGLPPAAELSVVRIKLRGSDLQQYGLQAPADAVAQSMLAEFVVGEDGLPRAIRIVR